MSSCRKVASLQLQIIHVSVGDISLSHFNNCSICLNITVTKKNVLLLLLMMMVVLMMMDEEEDEEIMCECVIIAVLFFIANDDDSFGLLHDAGVLSSCSSSPLFVLYFLKKKKRLFASEQQQRVRNYCCGVEVRIIERDLDEIHRYVTIGGHRAETHNNYSSIRLGF